jgi:acyl-CoA thioester hydrolase
MTAFFIELDVRDYECDLQGIVNNSVYPNYLEHARHCFLKAHGVDFAKLTAEGIHLVVTRSEIDYRHSLRPGDRFRVGVVLRKQGRIRWVFEQEIVRLPDFTTMVTAKITGTSLNAEGRPFSVAALEPLYSPDVQA